MSKPTVSRGWVRRARVNARLVSAFCLVPVIAIVATTVLVLSPARHGSGASAASSAPKSTTVAPAARHRIQASYAALPLAFEPNQGQTDSQVKYLARGNGYTLFLTENDAVFSLHSRSAAKSSTADALQSRGNPRRRDAQEDSTAMVRMQLLGSNSQARISASSQLPGTSNYFLGNDPGKWHSGVARYARVSYQDVYPGVNLAFYGAQRQLEFDFVVAPGANPAPIGFRIAGNRSINTDDSGNLIISSAAGDVLLHKPVAYQEQNGARQPVDARFSLQANNQITFELGNYDRSRELVIDPTVSYAYSTYLGGLLDDDGFGIAFDPNGNAYVTGETQSINFPIVGGVAGSNKGNYDVFVSKVAADGTSLLYSTYVGGSGFDTGNAIAVDASGDAFVAGGTASSDFPTTSGTFQTKIGSGASDNAFVFELSTTGNSLTYSTYLGGSVSDVAHGVAVDGSGNAYVVGETFSPHFPTQNPIQAALLGTANAFVTKLNPSGTSLVYSTYLGGSVADAAQSVALDSSDNAYVTGSTTSLNFPVTTGAYQTTFCPSCTTAKTTSDAFVTVINTAGSSFTYSTFLGGTGTDVSVGIAVDSSTPTNAYLTGSTTSANFPTKSALQATYGGSTDAFVTKLTPAGNGSSDLVYSTYLGGSGIDAGVGIAIDTAGDIYVAGQTASSQTGLVKFPLANPTQGSLNGTNDAFVSEFNPAGSALIFSTYLGGSGTENVGPSGGIAVDKTGTFIYVTGNTASTNFPLLSALQNTNASAASGGNGNDAFVVKYAQGPAFTMVASTPAAVSPGGTATSTITLTAYNSYGSQVNLACTVSGAGSPLPACGTISPNPQTPAGSPGSTASLMITTTANHAGNFPPRSVFYAMWLPVTGLSLAGVSFSSTRSRPKKLVGLFMVAMVMTALFLMSACGSGSSGGGGGGTGGTPPGNYTVTITGTDAANNKQQAQVILTVN